MSEQEKNDEEKTAQSLEKWLPLKDNDERRYSQLSHDEKLLRHVESIDRNIRFFAWILIIGLIGFGVSLIFIFLIMSVSRF
jgi:hypothetical protein